MEIANSRSRNDKSERPALQNYCRLRDPAFAGSVSPSMPDLFLPFLGGERLAAANDNQPGLQK
jgi:hypothetical protein